jgi:hypothetical protein
MVYFQAKNLGKLLQWTILVYFMAIWSKLPTSSRYILFPLVVFCGYVFVIFSRFGILHQGKSGNPVSDSLEMNVYAS